MVSLKVGERQVFRNVTLFPLFRNGGRDRATSVRGDSGGWSLLADALESGTLEVREVDEDGVVGELVVINRGSKPVLILDGEQLIGAKQNRTTARTILLDAASETRIPVSCMEQGRWRHVTRAMRHSREHSPPTLRRHARRVEADAARDAARRASAPADPDDIGRDRTRPRRGSGRGAPLDDLSRAQSDVWEAVAESQRRSGVHSPTGALDAVYADRKAGLDEWQARLPAAQDQVGLLAFVDGVPFGLDVLHDPQTYARIHGRLVRAYAFEAMDAAFERGDVAEDLTVEDAHAEAFMNATADADRHPLETVGMGEYSAMIGDVVGGELEWEDEVVHLSAFPGA